MKKVETNPDIKLITCVRLFLASLYSVVEKWEEWKFYDLEVAKLLTSDRLKTLKKYRHVIFHADYYDAPDASQFIDDIENMEWSAELAVTLQTALREWHLNIGERMEDHVKRATW